MTDSTLAPTDAEIDAIADQHKASGHGTVWPHAFARAVLAKWGAPAPVEPPEFCYFCGVACAASDSVRRTPAAARQPVAVPAGMEPVAVTTEQELLRLHGAPGSMATIFPADASGFPVSLYTFAQVQAMLAAAPSGPAREPLTDYRAYAVIDSMGWSLDDEEKDDMLELLRSTEAGHGITAAQKGGQHGTE